MVIVWNFSTLNLAENLLEQDNNVGTKKIGNWKNAEKYQIFGFLCS